MNNNFFEKVTKHLKNLDKMLAALPDFKGNSGIDEIISNINEPILIMVMGEFSTGKSTFINALVESEVAAIGALPTTAVITKLSYGATDKIEVVFHDGTKKTYSVSEFAKLTSESDANYKNLREQIDYVDRYLPIEILKSMTIIDSPGLNSIKAVHETTTRRFMEKADTVIWMFDANTPAKQTEFNALKRLNPRLSPIVVLNKIDTVDEEDGESVEDMIADLKRKLSNNKIQEQKIIGISAQDAFQGALKGDVKLLAASNITEFHNVISNTIVPNRNRYKENSMFDEIARLVDNISPAINLFTERVKIMRDENSKDYPQNDRKLNGIEDIFIDIANIFIDHSNEVGIINAAEDYAIGKLLADLNPDGALKFFKSAANLGNLDAMIEIGGICLDDQNYSEAMNWFKKPLEADNPKVYYWLGLKNYLSQNYSEALKWFNKSADVGDVKAYSWLGLMYYLARGTAQDFHAAFNWFKKSEENTCDQYTYYWLGLAYYNGNGTTKDSYKAFNYFKKGAELRDDRTYFWLGVMYNVGEGTTQDFQKALKWFKKSAEVGDSKSYAWLGIMYHEGEGTAKDYSEAFKWLKKSVETGDESAYYWLGLMYHNGEGVTQNYSEALKYFSDAARTGDKRAYYWLASMYRDGEGVTKDNYEALKWFKKSADSGNKYSYYFLGVMYFRGEGTAKDYSEALKWLKKSAETGEKASYFWLGEIYSEENNYSEALNWFRKAADKGDAFSMSEIARIYRYGNGVSKDTDEALRWYQKAIDAGYSDAYSEKRDLENEIERANRAVNTYNKNTYNNTPSTNRQKSSGAGGMVVGGVIGAAVAGPLGAVVGAWLGNKFFGND